MDAQSIMASLRIRAVLEEAMADAKRLHDDALSSGADAASVAYDAGRYAGLRDALDLVKKTLGTTAL